MDLRVQREQEVLWIMKTLLNLPNMKFVFFD